MNRVTSMIDVDAVCERRRPVAGWWAFVRRLTPLNGLEIRVLLLHLTDRCYITLFSAAFMGFCFVIILKQTNLITAGLPDRRSTGKSRNDQGFGCVVTCSGISDQI
jgi:hypothetical protein